ncbi:MAG: RNA polymerase sigma factor [bacterium]
MKKLIDADILERFKKGDTSAFKEIVTTYQDSIYNLCVYMIGDPINAEDLTQDVFIKAYTNLKSFKPQASIYTWLYRIAVNTCIDYKRKTTLESMFTHKNDEEIISNQPSNDPEPESISDSKQGVSDLKRALERLSKKLKTVIIMREIEGLSYEEIAQALDVSVGTVKSRLSRARNELQRLMKKTAL